MKKYIYALFWLVSILSIGSMGEEIHAKGNVGNYMIYRDDFINGQKPVVKTGENVKRLSVLVQCRKASKLKPRSQFRCYWNNILVYASGKTPELLPSLSSTGIIQKQTDTGSTLSGSNNTGNIELANYDVFIDGKIAMSTPNITKDQALAECTKLSHTNTTSEIHCNWSNTGILSFVPVIENIQVQLTQPKTEGTPYSFVVKNTEQELARLNLKSTSNRLRLQEVKAIHIGTATLDSILESNMNLRIIDATTTNQVGTGSYVGNLLSFTGMNEVLPKDTLKTYKILGRINDLANITTPVTLQFLINPVDVKVYIDGTGTAIPTGGSTFQTFPYSFGTMFPNVKISTVSENIFKISITNPDINESMQITGIWLNINFTLPTGTIFTGVGCLRDVSTTSPCGTNTASITSTANSIYLPISGLSLNPLLEKNGGNAQFEFFITSPNIFPTRSRTDIKVKTIEYIMKGKATDHYYGDIESTKTYYSK